MISFTQEQLIYRDLNGRYATSFETNNILILLFTKENSY